MLEFLLFSLFLLAVLDLYFLCRLIGVQTASRRSHK